MTTTQVTSAPIQIMMMMVIRPIIAKAVVAVAAGVVMHHLVVVEEAEEVDQEVAMALVDRVTGSRPLTMTTTINIVMSQFGVAQPQIICGYLVPLIFLRVRVVVCILHLILHKVTTTNLLYATTTKTSVVVPIRSRHPAASDNKMTSQCTESDLIYL